MSKTLKSATGFKRQLKTSNMEGHGVVASLHSDWRTRANNKPIVLNRNATIDTTKCA